MNPQEKTELTAIGLHRPFNMPLKSIVWVCRFSKGYRRKKGNDFYLDFFLWMLYAINEHTGTFNEQNAEGVIKPRNAQIILQRFAGLSYAETKEKVRGTLSERITDVDKTIYSSYKNTSYYITLAKKVNFINNRGELTPLGSELAGVRDYHFFDLADRQRLIIFRALSRDFFEHLIVITQSHKLIKGDRILEDEFFRAYLKYIESEGVIKYITSFDKNYLEVLRHWVATLNLCAGSGAVRKVYLSEIERLGLTSQYETIVHNTETFFAEEFKIRLKQKEQYERIRATYEKLNKLGQSEFGYVNLYDIKKSFRLSYNTYNELLNSYYADCRRNEIILFSNTVSSIDMRRRFLVAGNAVLKIRIIKKS